MFNFNPFLSASTNPLQKLFQLFYTLNNFNLLQPTLTHFNRLQPTSTHKAKKIPTSTTFIPLLPISTYFLYLTTPIYQREEQVKTKQWWLLPTSTYFYQF